MRPTLVLAGVAGLGLGFALVFASLRPPTPRAVPAGAVPAAAVPRVAVPEAPATPPPPPDESRSAQLFARNRGMASDPDLAAEYDELNAEYFRGVLPSPQVRWEGGLGDLGPMIADGFSVQGLTDGRLILMNPQIERDRDQRRRALCHEMVHVAVWPQDTGHGPIFQDQLRQLALMGAFKGVVATDEEKDAALATLRRTRAEIEAEERALQTDRAALDRTSQAAVDAYNARVQRQRDAAEAYNRLIEQYNLMVSYPDGLARERLKTRADGTSR